MPRSGGAPYDNGRLSVNVSTGSRNIPEGPAERPKKRFIGLYNNLIIND